MKNKGGYKVKFNLDLKNKKGSLDADVERIVEKGMDLHEKDWKEKFDTKHAAKKEIMELQHKQKIEVEEQNKTKKNWIEKIMEENRKTKELELEEQRRREETERIERQKAIKMKIIFSIILGILTIVFVVVGSLLGSASGDPNSGWHVVAILGIFTGFGIPIIWEVGNDEPNKKRKKK